jgi:hypothetical protein
MKKMKIITLAFGFLLPYMASADISGVGFAQTNSEAKKEALSDLSQVIKSEVRSTFESTSTNEGSKAQSNIKISSNLPILGAEFMSIDKKTEFEVQATLTPQIVDKLYATKLHNLSAEITSALDELGKANSNALKLDIYEELFSLLKEYDRYESVAVVLGLKLEKRPNITQAKVKIELAKLNSNIDSISMACKAFADSFTQKEIFVYPPLLQNNTTVAQFGSVFQKELKSKLNSAKTPNTASFLLVGEYALTDKAMVLSYELLNVKTNEVVKSKTININQLAYKNLVTQPKGVDFDQLLNSGVINSSDLKAAKRWSFL